MAEKLITANLAQVIRQKSRPGITIWNRLEGRPRADRFDRALRAEVRDALWMLTRQWQVGELRGDDAGSPILARVRLETTPIRTYQPAAGQAEPFDDSVPLETRVERMPLHVTTADHETALDIRLLAGRHWIKLVTPLAAAAAAQFIAAYPIHDPDPLLVADAPTVAHPEAWSTFAAIATRRMDGLKLYEYLVAGGGNRASDGIAALTGLEAQADALADRFVRWFERLITQPPANPAWLPDRLEYQFAVSSPHATDEKVFIADEYFQGHLDWYNFDIDQTRGPLGTTGPMPPEVTTLTMLPTRATFNGMPNTRWWAFEDGRTNFGDARPDTTDLAKLLLVEFGLVYANDWFVVPFIAPSGSVVRVTGIAVTNVFGERIWVEASGSGDDDDWQRWAMFLVSIAGQGHEPADTSLLLPPVAQQVLEGPPLEDVLFARDEMANMVWGVERGIALPTGDPARGREAAAETRTYFERDAERRIGASPVPPPLAEPAKIRYKVMSTVPENWIPMIPVHVAGDNRETQLQRAAMLRIIEGDPATPPKVTPRTSLLRVGLEAAPAEPYFLHEEEVPRAGIQVTQRFQRTRWRDGRAWVWLGVRKQTGRGEGSSGLAFDRLVDRTSR
jgi:hypothetical protein